MILQVQVQASELSRMSSAVDEPCLREEDIVLYLDNALSEQRRLAFVRTSLSVPIAVVSFRR
jgi:hypothetical protein